MGLAPTGKCRHRAHPERTFGPDLSSLFAVIQLSQWASIIAGLAWRAGHAPMPFPGAVGEAAVYSISWIIFNNRRFKSEVQQGSIDGMAE